MKRQTNEIADYLTTLDTEGQDFFEFAELLPDDEQLDGIKGGLTVYPKRRPDGGDGDWIGNHNETTASDLENEGEAQLVDLAVADEQADAAKGGSYAWVVTGDKTQSGNPIITNHNETTLSDQAGEVQVADLSVADEQADGAKGGPPAGGGFGGYTLNHNETTANDDEEEGNALLADLAVDDEQADETKGGCPYCLGGPMTNHNETTASDDEDEGKVQVVDLPVADGESDDIKGLTGIAGGMAGGSTRLNHNETTASDLEDEGEAQLGDLAVADEQADETRGGCPYCSGGPMTNHNETMAIDALN